MGMQDRDYYWEDRKRRDNKFKREDTYYRPKGFRGTADSKTGKPPKWSTQRGIAKQQWKVLFAFFVGGFVTFWATMIILHLNADLLLIPYEATRKLLNTIGAL